MDVQEFITEANADAINVPPDANPLDGLSLTTEPDCPAGQQADGDICSK